MQFFDSHSHYNDEKFDEDREKIIKQVLNYRVLNLKNTPNVKNNCKYTLKEKCSKESKAKLICAGYSLKSSIEALEIAKKYKNIYAIVGISPNDIPEKGADFEAEFIKQLEEIEKIAQDKKVRAIGEIGLDYYWNQENKEEQKLAFIKQIELANKLELPIVIHTREAIYDTLDILKNQIKPIKGGIFHCCPLNVDLVREGLKLGFYISFAGPVTFKNSKNADEIIKMVPIDKMLIETDCPYLSPDPKRGTRNDSRNLKYIAKKIAKVKEIPVREVIKATYCNAEKIFMIKK